LAGRESSATRVSVGSISLRNSSRARFTLATKTRGLTRARGRRGLGTGRGRGVEGLRLEQDRTRPPQSQSDHHKAKLGNRPDPHRPPRFLAEVFADAAITGLVESLARPGNNSTGFIVFEYGISVNGWSCSKRSHPVRRERRSFRELSIAGTGQLGAIQSVASSFGVELFPIGVRDAPEIERAVTAFSRGSNAGLIVTGGPSTQVHRHLIITLAARHLLPAVYPYRCPTCCRCP
jgi:hypothetical protein